MPAPQHASLLHAAVSAVCPIDGVAIGDPNDASTWSIAFAAGATKQQQVAAQKALAAITPAALTAGDATIQAAAAAIPDPLAAAKAQAISNLPKPAAAPLP